MWSGAGSNRRPSAFQVNNAKRYADLQKRTSLTSETALGGRCSSTPAGPNTPRPRGRTAPPPRPWAKGVVSKGQAEPIGHAFGSALTTEFILGASAVSDERGGQGHPWWSTAAAVVGVAVVATGAWQGVARESCSDVTGPPPP